ncbi:acyltransferase family protein [Faecalibacterium prausnitzii]|uniref:acyltransferase family protein n=1 Tax=Faecalibacterium prausnitzii TaxID=853 RepID=UPI003B42A0D7
MGGKKIFNRAIGVFDMPLFFVIAGYFIKGEKVEQYIRKSVNRLIIPYFFTAGVLIVL